jgi:hypothetical protein
MFNLQNIASRAVDIGSTISFHLIVTFICSFQMLQVSKFKLPLCVMKPYGGVAVYIYLCLTSALNGHKW